MAQKINTEWASLDSGGWYSVEDRVRELRSDADAVSNMNLVRLCNVALGYGDAEVRTRARRSCIDILNRKEPK